MTGVKLLLLLWLCECAFSDEVVEAHEGAIIECTYIAQHLVECGGVEYAAEDRFPFGSEKFTIYLVISICLICTAGMMSGLQLGLLSLDTNNLKVLMSAGEGNQKANATKILPLVKRHHLLMVTLLIVNAGCMESLPLFLDHLMSPFANIIVSVTAVLLFGEILPQAVCSRYGLAIGAAMSPIVWALVTLTFVLAWPISKLLDAVLGHGEGTFYRRRELAMMVDIQHTEARGDNKLTLDEATIIKGALSMKDKQVGARFTRLSQVYMLDFDGFLDEDTLSMVQQHGHSRVPLYRGSRENVLGMILIKELILIDPKQQTAISSLHIIRLPTVPGSLGLYEMLNMFQSGKSHMALVVNKRDCVTPEGIITLEDVLEELIQEDILDEDDLRRKVLLGQAVEKHAKALEEGDLVVGEGESNQQPSLDHKVSFQIPIVQSSSSFRKLLP